MVVIDGTIWLYDLLRLCVLLPVDSHSVMWVQCGLTPIVSVGEDVFGVLV